MEKDNQPDLSDFETPDVWHTPLEWALALTLKPALINRHLNFQGKGKKYGKISLVRPARNATTGREDYGPPVVRLGTRSKPVTCFGIDHGCNFYPDIKPCSLKYYLLTLRREIAGRRKISVKVEDEGLAKFCEWYDSFVRDAVSHLLLPDGKTKVIDGYKQKPCAAPSKSNPNDVYLEIKVDFADDVTIYDPDIKAIVDRRAQEALEAQAEENGGIVKPKKVFDRKRTLIEKCTDWEEVGVDDEGFPEFDPVGEVIPDLRPFIRKPDVADWKPLSLICDIEPEDVVVDHENKTYFGTVRGCRMIFTESGASQNGVAPNLVKRGKASGSKLLAAVESKKTSETLAAAKAVYDHDDIDPDQMAQQASKKRGRDDSVDPVPVAEDEQAPDTKKVCKEELSASQPMDDALVDAGVPVVDENATVPIPSAQLV